MILVVRDNCIVTNEILPVKGRLMVSKEYASVGNKETKAT